jgi:uncharacterized protein YndB with AHSA1/START domain
MIKVSTLIQKPVSEVWEKFTSPEDVMQWNNASKDWYCPKATTDLVVGGEFHYTMGSRDGKFSFVLGGTYTLITENSQLEYTLEDGRKVKVSFSENIDGVEVIQLFEPESENSPKLQQDGWQAILDNFKLHCEA